MPNTPKHKIFFGAPKGGAVVEDQIPITQQAPPAPTVQPWTWDTDEPIFSSATRTFDEDFDPEYLLGINEGLD